VAGLLGVVAPGRAETTTADQLDPFVSWRLAALRFEGNEAVKTKALRAVMATKKRRWFTVWRQRPLFDPVAFDVDLERVRVLYRSRGYYQAKVTHEVQTAETGDLVGVVVFVDEGPVVTVAEVTLTGDVPDAWRRDLRETAIELPDGAPFGEEAYDRGRAGIARYYRIRGYARVQVTKTATVDVAESRARIVYDVDQGPACTFGSTTIEGLEDVDAAVVRREMAFEEGAGFDPRLLEKTVAALRGLRLFESVRAVEDESRAPRVDVTLRVREAPPREVRLGVGYDTEEGPRALAAWRSYDFFGGARQLGFTGRVSELAQGVTADFLQPHQPVHDARLRLLVAQQRFDEDPYTLDQSRVMPRLEWDPSPHLALALFYRFEIDLLSDVDRDIAEALAPDATRDTTLLGGFGLGIDWTDIDDPLDPTRGWTASTTVEPVAQIFGGDVDFIRLVAEVRGFRPLPLGFVGALRFRLGAMDPLGDTDEIPLFERFYAGGTDSVRGYARRQIGPLIANEPLGGRTLVEWSAELRHPITETIGVVGFLDAGRVSPRSYDFPFADLQFGAGGGLRYRSPVGPLRLELGFPLDREGDDAAWQIHASVGLSF
jgi:outer membrane protein insertion porin family/translocation and assembly module TamA